MSDENKQPEKTEATPKQAESRIPFDLNAQEANGLLEILDIATKAEGMRVAPLCVHLGQRIQSAAQQFNQQNAEKPE